MKKSQLKLIVQEKENTNGQLTKKVQDFIYKYPVLLLEQNQTVQDYIKAFYLPYSIGIEIECDKKKDFEDEYFQSISNIMDVQTDSGEQRFRIPSGVNGMICLYNICKLLKRYSLLNPLSGIHYHIDFTDCFDDLITNEFVEQQKEYILTELDTWNYKGSYNDRNVQIDNRCWVQFQTELKTMEVRIGEMSFDYDLILSRIIHCCKIAKYLKNQYNPLFKLQNELKKLEEEEEKNKPLDIDVANAIVYHREIKMF